MSYFSLIEKFPDFIFRLGGRVAASGGTLHSYIAKQVGTKRNRDFLADTDVRASILRHAEEVCCLSKQEFRSFDVVIYYAIFC